MRSVSDVDDEIPESPIHWFFVLEVARKRGDFERAAQAKRELERLRVRVHYLAGRGQLKRREAGHVA